MCFFLPKMPSKDPLPPKESALFRKILVISINFHFQFLIFVRIKIKFVFNTQRVRVSSIDTDFVERTPHDTKKNVQYKSRINVNRWIKYSKFNVEKSTIRVTINGKYI